MTVPSDELPETDHSLHERLERLGRWDDDEVHRVRVSSRMLTELLTFGMTASAGSELVGPELLVLEYVEHDHSPQDVAEIVLAIEEELDSREVDDAE